MVWTMERGRVIIYVAYACNYYRDYGVWKHTALYKSLPSLLRNQRQKRILHHCATSLVCALSTRCI